MRVGQVCIFLYIKSAEGECFWIGQSRLHRTPHPKSFSVPKRLPSEGVAQHKPDA